LIYAIRSERDAEPVFYLPTIQSTAKSAIVLSSVSRTVNITGITSLLIRIGVQDKTFVYWNEPTLVENFCQLAPNPSQSFSSSIPSLEMIGYLATNSAKCSAEDLILPLRPQI
jgi:hypothetical protein